MATVDVSAWLGGATTATAILRSDQPIVRVALDPEAYFPDANGANDVWVGGTGP